MVRFLLVVEARVRRFKRKHTPGADFVYLTPSQNEPLRRHAHREIGVNVGNQRLYRQRLFS
jgi:hypothetical protein